MTRSGRTMQRRETLSYRVLIPLLVDDPLWEYFFQLWERNFFVLIPLLVDDPLWAILNDYEQERINKS